VSIASPFWLSGELPCCILEAVYHDPLPSAIDRAHIPPGGPFYPDSRIHQHRTSMSYHCSLLPRSSELLFQLVHIIPYKFPHIRSSWLCIPISSRAPSIRPETYCRSASLRTPRDHRASRLAGLRASSCGRDGQHDGKSNSQEATDSQKSVDRRVMYEIWF
jgi:hypothetical protein